jgi:hypothetical protein
MTDRLNYNGSVTHVRRHKIIQPRPECGKTRNLEILFNAYIVSIKLHSNNKIVLIIIALSESFFVHTAAWHLKFLLLISLAAAAFYLGAGRAPSINFMKKAKPMFVRRKWTDTCRLNYYGSVTCSWT